MSGAEAEQGGESAGRGRRGHLPAQRGVHRVHPLDVLRDEQLGAVEKLAEQRDGVGLGLLRATGARDGVVARRPLDDAQRLLGLGR